MLQRLNAVFAALLILASIAFLGRSAVEAQQAAPNPRIALVIGNATYRDAALATAANDAGLVAETLQAAGFDVVGARDLDGQSLRTAFRDFLQKAAAAGPDMQAFVYLSGRAVQYAGDNYFVPVDAVINRDADVPIEAMRVSDFSHALAATPGRARIIVLDAARANPYAAQGSPLAPGLALVDPERGELIAFNAAPGTLAGDEEGPYGVYAKTLAGAIRQGGVDIAQAFDQTRVLVNTETQGALLPWSASKLDGPFYVFERDAEAPPATGPTWAQMERRPISSFPVAEAYAAALERDTIEGYREFLAAYPHSDQANRVRAILAVRREAAFWRRTVSAGTPRAFWTYLRVYPRGAHVADARRRLAMLSAAFEPRADFQPETFADLAAPPPEELAYEQQPIYAFDDFGPPPPPPPVQYVYVEDDDWRDLPPPPPPAAIGVLPVLGFALPIAVGAVAFHGLFHHDGIAPRGERRWRQPPPAPPPLPANIKPVAPPPPVAVAPVANAALVKPLRPIGRPRQPGAPVAAPGKPVGGKPLPAAHLPNAAKPAAAPLAPVGAKPPAAARAISPGAKPALAPAPSLAPIPNAAPRPVTPAPTPANIPAPKPNVVAKPPLAAAPAAPRPPPVVHAPAPVVHAPPAPLAAAPAAPRPPPVVHAPAPVVHAPPAPIAAAPPAPRPPPVVHAPAPVVHAPAAPRPPPVVHAPAPVVRAPAAPRPPPVVHAPAPVVRAPPAPVRAQACGKPGLPPCPK